MGGFLVSKFVKPTKVLGSWPSDQSGLYELLFAQAQPHIGACTAGVLGKTNAAVRKKICGLDPTDRPFN
jgi:hypothetical protein